MTYEHFRLELSRLLNETGESNRGICKTLHIDPSHLSLYLQGKRDISGEKLFALMEYLNLPFFPQAKDTIKSMPVNKFHYKELWERFTGVNFEYIKNDGVVKSWDELLQFITETGTKRDLASLEKLLKSTSAIAHSKHNDILYLAFKIAIRDYTDSDATELYSISHFPAEFSFDLFPEIRESNTEIDYENGKTDDMLISNNVEAVPF